MQDQEIRGIDSGVKPEARTPVNNFFFTSIQSPREMKNFHHFTRSCEKKISKNVPLGYRIRAPAGSLAHSALSQDSRA